MVGACMGQIRACEIRYRMTFVDYEKCNNLKNNLLMDDFQ